MGDISDAGDVNSQRELGFFTETMNDYMRASIDESNQNFGFGIAIDEVELGIIEGAIRNYAPGDIPRMPDLVERARDLRLGIELTEAGKIRPGNTLDQLERMHAVRNAADELNISISDYITIEDANRHAVAIQNEILSFPPEVMTTAPYGGVAPTITTVGAINVTVTPVTVSHVPPQMPQAPVAGVAPVVETVPVQQPVATYFMRMYAGQEITPVYSMGVAVAQTVHNAAVNTVPHISPLAPASSPRPPNSSTFNDTGYVSSWRGVETAPNSVYSEYTLNHYNGTTRNGYAHISFMEHLNVIADLIMGRVRWRDIYHREEQTEEESGPNLNDDSFHDNPPGPGADLTVGGNKPIILDLDGNGIQITDLSQSTTFVDGGDGLEHRTAWAGAGDGVLFYDPDGSGEITEMRQYVFTEWDPTATSDMEALASVFDTSGNGELSGAELDDFRIMVTNADGLSAVEHLAA